MNSWNWCQLGRNWFEKIEKRETNSNQICPTNANEKVQFWPGQHIILKLASQKKTSVLWWYWVDIKVVERCYCFNYDVDYQQADEHQMLLSKFEVWASLPPVSVNSQQTSAIGDSTEYLYNLNFVAFLIQSKLLVHSFPIHTQIFCDLGCHFIPILLHLISDSSDSLAIPMQFLWRLHFWE